MIPICCSPIVIILVPFNCHCPNLLFLSIEIVPVYCHCPILLSKNFVIVPKYPLFHCIVMVQRCESIDHENCDHVFIRGWNHTFDCHCPNLLTLSQSVELSKPIDIVPIYCHCLILLSLSHSIVIVSFYCQCPILLPMPHSIVNAPLYCQRPIILSTPHSIVNAPFYCQRPILLSLSLSYCNRCPSLLSLSQSIDYHHCPNEACLKGTTPTLD